MVLSKEAFNKIVDKYPTMVLDTDPAEALHFAAEIIGAELEAQTLKTPYATRSIDRLLHAEHEICNLARDADNEVFSEEG